jgi:hypothetical protein
LANPQDERFVYDLRVVSEPDPQVPARGRVHLAILCRVQGERATATGYAREFLRLLRATVPEYEFELEDGPRVRYFLSPFELRHIVGVCRRFSWEALDTLRSEQRSRRRIGFAQAERVMVDEQEGAKILHVFPYLPGEASFAGLFNLLLLHPHPILISCRLQPTVLAPEEQRFLEGQIAACERHAQMSLSSAGGDLGLLQPTLREQARVYQEYQIRMLYGLQDNAAVVTLEIASPQPIPHTIGDAVGGLVTAPAGGNVGAMGIAAFLAGGYQLVALDPPAAHRRGVAELEVVLPSDARLPEAARRLPYLFDSLEATAAFRLPDPPEDRLPGLEVRHWRVHRAPADLPQAGLLVARTPLEEGERPVRIGRQDRLRHVYTVGQTGTGKTTLLKTMILDDFETGEGVCVIDPHGDLFRELLDLVPEHRVGDVVLLDPTDVDHPVGLNLVECEDDSQRHFIAQEFVGILARLIQDEFGSKALGEFTGPVFFQHVRMNLLLAMSNPEEPGTLLDFYNIFHEEGYWQRWVPLRVSDPQLEAWVSNVLRRTDYLKPGSDGMSLGGWIASKFHGFVFDPMLRNIFGQRRSTIDLREIMDGGKILLVNLAKGELTEANSRFLGMLVMAKLQAAAMGRVRIPKEQRRDFHVYVDEFQSIATQSFVTLVSEARKFGLSLTLANQFVSQIADERIINSVLGNAGTLICFRLGPQDAELVARHLEPFVSPADLLTLPNYYAHVRTLMNGQTVQPFTVQTLLSEVGYSKARGEDVREYSRKRYGRPRQLVEQEIVASLRLPEGEAGR